MTSISNLQMPSSKAILASLLDNYKSAIALNNMGIILMTRGHLELAQACLNDAVYGMSILFDILRQGQTERPNDHRNPCKTEIDNDDNAITETILDLQMRVKCASQWVAQSQHQIAENTQDIIDRGNTAHIHIRIASSANINSIFEATSTCGQNRYCQAKVPVQHDSSASRRGAGIDPFKQNSSSSARTTMTVAVRIDPIDYAMPSFYDIDTGSSIVLYNLATCYNCKVALLACSSDPCPNASLQASAVQAALAKSSLKLYDLSYRALANHHGSKGEGSSNCIDFHNRNGTDEERDMILLIPLGILILESAVRLSMRVRLHAISFELQYRLYHLQLSSYPILDGYQRLASTVRSRGRPSGNNSNSNSNSNSNNRETISSSPDLSWILWDSTVAATAA